MRDDQGSLCGTAEEVEIVKESYGVVETILRTEKGVFQAKDNKYFLSVRKNANKIQIKRAVEDIFKVKVLSVNTQVMPGKLKRVRQQLGKTPEWKKAVVTLQEGQKIDVA